MKPLVAAATTRFPRRRRILPPLVLPLLLPAVVAIFALSWRVNAVLTPEYVIQGLGHNVPFLRDVTRNADFAAGDYSTSFIDKHYPDG